MEEERPRRRRRRRMPREEHYPEFALFQPTLESVASARFEGQQEERVD